MLVKVGAVVAAGLVIGAPVAALSGLQTRTRVPGRSDQATETSSIPAALATRTRTRYAARLAVIAPRSHEGRGAPVAALAPGSGAIRPSTVAGTGGSDRPRSGRPANTGSYGIAVQLPSSAVPIARQVIVQASGAASRVKGDVSGTGEAGARVVREVPTSPPGVVESPPPVVQVP